MLRSVVRVDYGTKRQYWLRTKNMTQPLSCLQVYSVMERKKINTYSDFSFEEIPCPKKDMLIGNVLEEDQENNQIHYDCNHPCHVMWYIQALRQRSSLHVDSCKHHLSSSKYTKGKKSHQSIGENNTRTERETKTVR